VCANHVAQHCTKQLHDSRSGQVVSS
jgi:hypothetical protein